MSDRRSALVDRFRASAGERLHRLLRWVEAIEDGGAGDHLPELKRELHTLKGEATMLGFGSMSEVVHAAEGRLARDEAAAPSARHAGARVVARACEALIRALKDPAGGEAELVVVREALEAPSGDGGSAAPPASVPREGARPSSSSLVNEKPREVDRWVQVQARRVDQLCELSSDFEVGFRSLAYSLRELADSRTNLDAGLRALLPDLDRARAALEEITASAWSLRLVPLEGSLAPLASHGREIAASQGKRLRVHLRAGDAQIERTVLDAIWEPLLHLVRNAVDHGIEAPEDRGDKGDGTLAIEAEAAGASILLSIADDGRGIALERLRETASAKRILTAAAAAAASDAALLELIFLHGFSTRATVSDLSGRGVGLDVVRSSVESIGGSVRVTTTAGRGTRFMLSVPASISKERALVFRAGKALYALPSRAVASVVQLETCEVDETEEARTLMLGDDAIDLRSIGAALGPVDSTAEPWAAVTEVGTRRVAFSMDRPLGELALLRRPVDALLAASGAVNGSAILEDGRVVLVLSPAGLIRQSDRRGRGARRVVESPPRQARVLVVDDSPVVRDLVKQILETAGFGVALAEEGAAALAAFSAWRPDAVLLDIDMPVLDGFEVLRRIRATNHGVPIVMLSLRASEADQRRTAALGANAHLSKSSFEEATLLAALRGLVDGPGKDAS